MLPKPAQGENIFPDHIVGRDLHQAVFHIFMTVLKPVKKTRWARTILAMHWQKHLQNICGFFQLMARSNVSFLYEAIFSSPCSLEFITPFNLIHVNHSTLCRGHTCSLQYDCIHFCCSTV
jgi:hypothetical protein